MDKKFLLDFIGGNWSGKTTNEQSVSGRGNLTHVHTRTLKKRTILVIPIIIVRHFVSGEFDEVVMWTLKRICVKCAIDNCGAIRGKIKGNAQLTIVEKLREKIGLLGQRGFLIVNRSSFSTQSNGNAK